MRSFLLTNRHNTAIPVIARLRNSRARSTSRSGGNRGNGTGMNSQLNQRTEEFNGNWTVGATAGVWPIIRVNLIFPLGPSYPFISSSPRACIFIPLTCPRDVFDEGREKKEKDERRTGEREEKWNDFSSSSDPPRWFLARSWALLRSLCTFLCAATRGCVVRGKPIFEACKRKKPEKKSV